MASPALEPILGNMFSIFVIGETYAELKNVFDKLAEGAKKEWFQDLHEMPFGIYGQFFDRYGVQWIFKGTSKRLFSIQFVWINVLFYKIFSEPLSNLQFTFFLKNIFPRITFPLYITKNIVVGRIHFFLYFYSYLKGVEKMLLQELALNCREQPLFS